MILVNVKKGDIMKHKQQQTYHALVAISIFLLIIVPVQIKAFWYALRIIVLLSIVLFLKYMVKNADMKNRHIITFKSYFWLEILIYFIYHQYAASNTLYLSILFFGYIMVLVISFVYGKKIKWKESAGFLVEYSNAIVHAFQKFKAPFSGKIVHIFPEQSAVI